MMRKSIASVLLMLITIAWVATIATQRVRAQTETLTFAAALSALNEVSGVAASELGARGSGVFTLVVTRSGGTITAATATFDANITGLASNVILTHIHRGAAGVNGPVVVDTGISPAAPIIVAAGTASFTRGGITVAPALAQEIISNPSGFYFNTHTVLSPGGAVRGQLSFQQTTVPGGAPTLSEWGAIMMTLLFIAVCTFFLLGRSKTALAMAGATDSIMPPMRAIDWKLLARVTIVIEIFVGVALVALRADAVDIAGALLSGAILAFTVHLFIVSARRR